MRFKKKTLKYIYTWCCFLEYTIYSYIRPKKAISGMFVKVKPTQININVDTI